MTSSFKLLLGASTLALVAALAGCASAADSTASGSSAVTAPLPVVTSSTDLFDPAAPGALPFPDPTALDDFDPTVGDPLTHLRGSFLSENASLPPDSGDDKRDLASGFLIQRIDFTGRQGDALLVTVAYATRNPDGSMSDVKTESGSATVALQDRSTNETGKMTIAAGAVQTSFDFAMTWDTVQSQLVQAADGVHVDRLTTEASFTFGIWDRGSAVDHENGDAFRSAAPQVLLPAFRAQAD